MATELTQDIPIGDLQFYDNFVPSLDAGNWTIAVSHTLDGIATGALTATQEFVVSAPQVAMDPSGILNQYPPAGSTGRYGEVLAHIVLNDALLPWERKLAGSAARQPWLALLVLQESEILGGADSPTRSQVTTVSGFLEKDSSILKPTIVKEDDVADTESCTFIQLAVADFAALTPRLEELRFLAHCRQSNIADKAEQGLEQNGLFSAVVSNRFPVQPDAGITQPRKNIAHLVSVEGLEVLLVDAPNFGGHTSVAMISLASWTFNVLADQAQDFAGLAAQLVTQEFDGKTWHPDNMWLRLPAPNPPIDTGSPAGAEADRRVRDGFVPMLYQLRTGEQTFAWYRGPLAPVLATPLPRPDAFPTADSALIYQNAFGVFDVSLAAAWEAGRAIALADRGFGQMLFEFRRRGHRLTDALHERLQSDAFSAAQIDGLSHDTTIQNALLGMLDHDLLQAIGSAPTPLPTNATATTVKAAAPDPDPATALRNFAADPNVQAQITALVGDELTPLAKWLARLLLLYPVPFNLMVPDSRMLETETLRFFYLDSNWLRALHDGAVSIGVESSRDTFFHEMFGDILFQSAMKAVAAYRAGLTGVDPPAFEVARNEVGGFLLRSALVSGWPNLAVQGAMKDGTQLKIMRLDHLAPNLLLCLFWGVPDVIMLSEPQEGFRFGVDDDGKVALRQPVAGGATPLGAQLPNHLLPVLPNCLRAGGRHVLNLAPASADGLLQQIQKALGAAGAPVSGFGPSDFALQMVKAPEAIRFFSQSS
jgi:hypothetical protein